MRITSLKQLERDTARCLTDDFYERGWNSPSLTWLDILKKLAPCYGLVTDTGKPVNMAARRILAMCKLEWMKGHRDAQKE